MKTIINTIYLFTVAISLAGCRSVWREPVPDGEILYLGEPTYPSHFLGFVQADGKKNQLFKLERRFEKPVWSADGNFLYGLYDGIHSDLGYPAYWDLLDGKFSVCKRNLPYFLQIQGAGNPDNPYEVIVQNITEIYLIDLSTCKRLDTWLDYSDRESGKKLYEIAGFSYSPSNRGLVYGLKVSFPWPDPTITYQLVFLDLITGERVQLAEGISPSWSPDGSQIAYIGLDGLYVMSVDNDRAEPRQLVDQIFFNPADNSFLNSTTVTWSPDGVWLAYHRCSNLRYCKADAADLYKISSNGGQEELILEGGKYPSWRP